MPSAVRVIMFISLWCVTTKNYLTGVTVAISQHICALSDFSHVYISHGVGSLSGVPPRACAARVTSVIPSVRPFVCLSVTTFSATTRNKAANKRYQRVQYHTGLIYKMAIFVKVLRSKVMA